MKAFNITTAKKGDLLVYPKANLFGTVTEAYGNAVDIYWPESPDEFIHSNLWDSRIIPVRDEKHLLSLKMKYV
jgi:hypothetical protein